MFLVFLPKMQVLGMTRTVEVSHWGNVAVEETYHMKHVGAELKVQRLKTRCFLHEANQIHVIIITKPKD